jgi:diaminopimelate decarboxylase
VTAQYFGHRDGRYHAEDVPLQHIAQKCPTPFYCYSRAAIEQGYRAYSDAFAGTDVLICYAIKANSNQSVIGILRASGAGADVVSQGELRRALLAGIPADRIVFSGVAKTTREIEAALDAGILRFNVESIAELLQISAVASSQDKTAEIAFRINPDIDAGTHEKIATGKSGNKFGIPWQSAKDACRQAAGLPGVEVRGIDLHIGSQILAIEPFERAFRRVRELVVELRADGHRMETIDLGGGLGIRYDPKRDAGPSVAEYARLAKRYFADLGVRLIVEPGRSIVGHAGILVSRVIYVKPAGATNFLIIDAAMNDFLRPSMYGAFHNIVADSSLEREYAQYDVVGPVCETGDTFARTRKLPRMAPGDLLVIEDAGAYGSVMASGYNTRPLVPEVLVDHGDSWIIRPRPHYDSIIEMDVPWTEPV